MMELVWIIPKETYGYVVTRNAYASVVNYTLDDKLYRETFENEDLLEWGEQVNDDWTE